MTDIKVTLLELLRENWALDFTPRFTADRYEAEERTPQVVVSQILTRPRAIGFTENPAEAMRRFEAQYAVDVWSRGDQERRWRMLKEVDRILQANCDEPGGNLEFVEPSAWRDLDEGDSHPRLYRSRVRVQVLYYI